MKKPLLSSLIICLIFLCSSIGIAQTLSPHSESISPSRVAGARPSVAVAPTGNFLAIWQQGSQLRKRLYDNAVFQWRDAARTPNFHLARPADYQLSLPEIDVSPSRDYVTTYSVRETDGGFRTVHFTRLRLSGQPVDRDVLVDNSVYGSSTCMFEDNSFAIAYGRSFGTDIYLKSFTDIGSSLGGRVIVNSTVDANRRSEPQIASASNGNFVVVWKANDQDGDGEGIYARLFNSEGEPVGAEFQVNTTIAGNQNRAKVSMAFDGSFVIVWESEDGAGAGVYAQRFDPNGQPVGAEFRANITTQNDQSSPDVAHDGFGNFAIFWASEATLEEGNFNEDIHSIRGMLYNASGEAMQNTEYIIASSAENELIEGSYSFPRIDINESGEAAIIWQIDGIGLECVRLHIIYPPNEISLNNYSIRENREIGTFVGTFNSSEEIGGNTFTYELVEGEGSESNEFFQIELVRDVIDNFIVVFSYELKTNTRFNYEDQGEHSIRVRATNELGEFIEQTIIIQVIDQPEPTLFNNPILVDDNEGNKQFPSVAMAPDGSYIVVWEAEDDDSFGIYGQKYSNENTPLGDRFLINTFQQRTQQKPDIDIARDGSFIVVWESLENSWNIKGQRFNPDATPFGEELTLSQADGLAPDQNPAVSIGNNGSFVVAWERNDPASLDGNEVYANRFESFEDLEGEIFQVNVTVGGDQFQPDVAISANNSFAISWVGEGSDGALGVHVRTYNNIGTANGEKTLTPENASFEIKPNIEESPNGNFMVSWLSFLSGEDDGIYIQRINSVGNNLGALTRVTSSDLTGNDPRLVVDSDGNHTIVFHSNGIYYQSFNNSNIAFGNYQALSNSGSNSDIGGTDEKFVIVWQDANEIYAQVFVDNAAPSDIVLDNNEVEENGEERTLVGTLRAIDVDNDDTHSYELIAGEGDTHNDFFTIEENQLLANISFDFEEQNSYSVRIRATDQIGATIERALEIQVVDINEAPESITLSNSELTENNEIGILIGDFTTVDQDQGDSHTYELVAGEGDTHNDSFIIEENQLLANTSFDFEEQNSYSVRVRSTDVQGLSIDQTFEIQIIDIPEPIGAIQDEFFVNQTTEQRQSRAKVAMDQNGNFVIIWENRIRPNERNNHYHEIFWRSFNADGQPTSDETRVDPELPDNPNNELASDIAMMDDGSFVITWDNPLTTGIKSRRYSLENEQYVPEDILRVDQNIQEHIKESPSISINNNGDYVIAWENRVFEQNHGEAAGDYRGDIYVRRMRGQEDLGNPIVVNDGIGAQKNPDIAIDELGNFAVVWWNDISANTSGIFLRGYNSLGEISTEEIQVNQTAIGVPKNPSITYLSNGNLAVTWHIRVATDREIEENQIPEDQLYLYQDRSQHVVKLRIFDAQGEALTDEIQVNQYTVNSQDFPEIAAFENDSFVVTWESHSQEGSDEGVYARYFQYNPQDSLIEPLGNEFQINRYTNAHQQKPSIALRSNGEGVIVWESGFDSGQNDQPIERMQDGDWFGIFGRKISPDESIFGAEALQEPELVNTITAGTQNFSSIGVSQDGNFSIAWEGASDINATGIYKRDYMNEIAQEQRIIVSNDLQTVHCQVAQNSAGMQVVVWHEKPNDFRSEGIELKATLFDENGIEVAENIPINTFTARDQVLPSVGMDEEGNFVVAWHGWGGSREYGIYARRYNAQGEALSEPFLVNENLSWGKAYADIAVQANGNFMIVWQSAGQHNGRTGIYGKIYNALGEVLQSEFQLNSNEIKNNQFPSVTILADEGYLTVWTQQEDTGALIIGRKYDRGGNSIGAAFQVNTEPEKYQLKPQIAADQEGNFIVAWSAWKSYHYKTYARFFDKGRISTGLPFEVHLPSNFNQYAPSVGAWGDRNFVVSWTGSDDRRSDGIYMRRYGIPQVPNQKYVSETDLFNEGNINLYPNPGTDIVYLETSEGFKSNTTIRLYDMLGKSLNIKIKAEGNTIQLDASSIRKGVYFIEVFWGSKNKSVVKKWVKE